MIDHALPNLGSMSAQMAKNISRTAAYADSMAATVDKLVMASTREDWDEIGAVSQQLVDEARKNGRRDISALAQIACDESTKPNNATNSRRSLIRLIGSCGR